MRPIAACLFLLATAATGAAQLNREAEEASIRMQAGILDDPATTASERRETLLRLRAVFCELGPPQWRYGYAYRSVAALREDAELGPLATQFLGELRIGLSTIVPNPEKRRRLAQTGCRSHWILRPPRDAAGRKRWVIARARELDEPTTSPDDRYSTLRALRESYCGLAPLYGSYAGAVKAVRGVQKDPALAAYAKGFLRELQIGLDRGRSEREKRALLGKTGCVAAPGQP